MSLSGAQRNKHKQTKSPKCHADTTQATHHTQRATKDISICVWTINKHSGGRGIILRSLHKQSCVCRAWCAAFIACNDRHAHPPPTFAQSMRLCVCRVYISRSSHLRSRHGHVTITSAHLRWLNVHLGQILDATMRDCLLCIR